MTKKLPEAGNVTAETASAPVNGEGVPVVANAKLAGVKALKPDAGAKKASKVKGEVVRENAERDEVQVADAEQSLVPSDGSFKLAMADNGVMSDALAGMGAAAEGADEGGQDAPAGGGAAAPAAAASGGGSSLPYILGGIAVAGGVGALAASGGGKETPAPQIPPTYTVSVDKQNANEGDTLRFTISGTNAKPGDVVSYQITGISAEDLSSGSLTGSVTLDASLRAFVDVAIARDAKTEGVENLRMVLGQGASVNVTVADTSQDQTGDFTTGTDLLVGDKAGSADDNVYVGRVGSTFFSSGSATTFQSGDEVDGGGGVNTLRLFMDPGAIADGVKVSNMQVLNLRLNAATSDGPASELVLTDWDRSLQRIDIESNKSELVLREQQVIVPISITDRSTASFSSSYTFNYAAGVLDGDADAVAFTINNVNGSNGSTVGLDTGVEAVSFAVADRAGDQYASNINLNAGGVTSIVVTQGLEGQAFTMNANVFSDEELGASFVSTAFAGNMNLTSGDLDTVALGAGDDTLVINGRGGEGSSYHLGAGDNSMEISADLAGSITALGGNDAVRVNGSVEATGRVSVGNGDNEVSIENAVRGQVTAGDGDDLIEAFETESEATVVLDFNGVEVEVDQEITVVITNGVEIVEVSYTVVDADLDLTAKALAEKLANELGNALVGQLQSVQSVINGADVPGTVLLTLFNAAPGLNVTSSVGASSAEFTHRGVINAGNGDNTVGVEWHAGEIVTGTGDDNVAVGEDTAINSVVNVGGGANNIDIANDHFGAVIAGAGDDRMTVGNDLDYLSSTNLGNGDNVLLVADEAFVATVVAGDGDNRIVIGGTLDDDGEIVAQGDGIITESSITLGDGTNRVDVLGSIDNSSVTFGDGDGNILNVGGNVTAGTPGTITFGDGDANALNIDGSLIGDAVVFGAGTGNEIAIDNDVSNASITVAGTATSLTIGNDVVASTITVGNGANVALIGGDVEAGSQITFGTGADTLTLGTGENGSPKLRATDESTNINMGAGDDQVTMVTKTDGSTNVLVRSGGFIDGEGGNDTLTVRAAETLNNLIARTDNQVVTVDYSEELFTLGQVITVTFERGDERFEVSYTVKESDFIQGPEGLAAKVAQSVADQLNDDLAFDALFGATASEGVVTITSDQPLEDFTLSSSVGVVDVVQISDAEITSFETLELIALNSDGEDATLIGADFDLIEGTNNVDLISEVTRNETPNDADLNGAYTAYSPDGPVTFDLDNLNGGEAITVSGYETSATGNSQVSRIVVDIDETDHVVGDTISVTINGVTIDYVVTAADLNADTGLVDANQIATSLKAAITSAATAAGLSVALDLGVEEGGPVRPQITLIGQPGVAFALKVEHTRFEATELEDLAITGTEFNVRTLLNNLKAGDVLTLTIGDETSTYTVSEEECVRLEADAIVAHFKDALGIDGDWGTLTSKTEGELTVTRVIDLVEGRVGVNQGDQTVASLVLSAQDTDDGVTDVVVDANLADDATNTTMDLTVAGEGDFDIAITGGTNVNVRAPMGGEDSGFTDLELTLADGFDHTINTGGVGFTPAVSALARAYDGAVSEEEAGFIWVLADVELADGRIVRFENNFFGGVFVSEDGGETFEKWKTTIDSVNKQTVIDFFTYGVDPSVTEAVFAEGNILNPYLLWTALDDFITSVTVYDGDAGDADTSSYVVEGLPAGSVGNFAETITVRDTSGVDTTGSSIVLEDVLAHTVTSTSKANLTVDQYATRDNMQPEETITVTTGSGDDHLITLARSAMAEGSSINLGSGRNTLSLGSGAGVTLRHTGGDLADEPGAAVAVTVNTQTQFLANNRNSDGLTSVDRDWFKVTLEAGKTYQFILSTVDDDADGIEDFVDFQVYSDAFYTFAGASAPAGAGEPATLEFTPTADGVYYIRAQVSGDAPQQSGTQVLALEVIESDDPVTELQYDIASPDLSLIEREEITPLSLDFSEMDYSGGLAVFELLNDVDAAEATPLVMPGGADKVEELKVQDFELDGDLTIVGAANDFTITADDDFNVDGRTVIQNAAGAQITGNLVINADLLDDGDVDVNIGNARLASITVAADDDIDVRFSDNQEAGFVVGNVSLDSVGSGGEAQVSIDDNTDTSITLGDVAITSDDDSDLDINGNVGLTAVIGDVTLTSDEDTDLAINRNEKSNIKLGAVTMFTDDGDSNSDIDINANVDSTISLGPVSITVYNDPEEAIFEIGSDSKNIRSTVTVDGPVDMKSERDSVRFAVQNNEDTDVSVAAGSVITLESCNSSVFVGLDNNANFNDPVGPDPDALPFIKDHAVTVGDLVLDAAGNARVNINDNDDDTYYGDLAVNVGDVDIFTYSSAELNVRGNESASIDVGNVGVRSENSTTIVVGDNFGRIYNNTLVDPARDEPDFITVDIDSITVDADEQAYLGIGRNEIATVDIGDVSLLGGTNAGIEIVYNNGTVPGEDEVAASLLDITLGDVTIEADALAGLSIGLNYSNNNNLFGPSTGGEDGGNINSAIDLGDVTIKATGEDGEASLQLANNRGEDGRGTVDMDSVTMESSNDAEFFIYNNTLTGVTGEDEAAITVGDVTMTADDNANLAITGNGDQGNGWPVQIIPFGIGEDAGPTTMAFGNITLTAGEGEDTGSAWNAQVDITGNAVTVLTAKDVTLSGVNTGLFVNDNGKSDVTLGDVSLTSTGEDEYVADVTVNNNYASDVTMGDVTISSDEDALIEVDGNYGEDFLFGPFGGEDDSNVTMGNVDVDADGDARFFVRDNRNTDVTIAMDDEADDGRGSIDIDAASIGQYGEDAEGFDVLAGEDTSVTLGHISLTASGSGTNSDVDLNIVVGGEDNFLIGPYPFGEDSNSIDTGDITINADGDVYATLSGGEDYLLGPFGGEDSLTVGDIVINSGLEPETLDKDGEATNPDVSSDLLLQIRNMDGNEDVDGKQTISVNAGSRGAGVGNAHVSIATAPDLVSLTVAATNAEVYLTGDISTDTPETTVFELDLSGLTGSFGEDEDAVDFRPIGSLVADQEGQDSGSFVSTYDADFGGDIVRVSIGSGDLIYNAAHSSWGLGPSDWNDGVDGWYSLGTNGDFDPTPQTQTINLAGDNEWRNGDGNSLTFDYNNTTYTFAVGTGNGELNADGSNALEIGNTGLTVRLSGSDGFIITGTSDGAEFTAISEYNANLDGDDDGGPDTNVTVTSGSSSISPDPKDPATDNWGQDAKETFTFTGKEVGEVVIGGFSPGEWGSVNPDNGRLTDRLDFSQFDWNGDGEVNAADAGMVDLSYFKITVEDGDGYFKDVVIDFIGGAKLAADDVDFGTIRLVGVGEFEDAVEKVSDSFVFG